MTQGPDRAQVIAQLRERARFILDSADRRLMERAADLLDPNADPVPPADLLSAPAPPAPDLTPETLRAIAAAQVYPSLVQSLQAHADQWAAVEQRLIEFTRSLQLCELHDPSRWEAAEGQCPLCEAHALHEKLAQTEQALQETRDRFERYVLAAERTLAEKSEAHQAQWQERDWLRAALVGLVGVDGREDLEQMEGVMRLLPAPAEDKAKTIDAIHALIGTLASQAR